MAEKMHVGEFSALMNRFYEVATEVLVDSHAFIDKLVGDEVVAIYLPVFTGENHALPAVTAARDLLRVTGHGEAQDPWVPVGVGVHSGSAYFGTVKGSEGTLSDLTALGDPVNVAARLAQRARKGEALVTDAAARSAGLDTDRLKQRNLRLKGKTELVPVRVLTAATETM
jgi:adenylate cyclase